MTYGYIRVSTKEQNEDRQLIAMREFQVDRIYMDKKPARIFCVLNIKRCFEN